MPETVIFFEERGIKVRELKELSTFKGIFVDYYNYYVVGGRSVMRYCDIIKSMILFDEGGLYMDLDYWVEEWSADIHYHFDLFTFMELHYKYYVRLSQLMITFRQQKYGSLPQEAVTPCLPPT